MHTLTKIERLYCFSGWERVSSDVDNTCGMHILINLYRVTRSRINTTYEKLKLQRIKFKR